MAQGKKKLAPKDYDKWHTLSTGATSKAGNWVSYGMHYKENKDTLFLKHIPKNRLYAFPSGYNGQINGDGTFFIYMVKSDLHFLELTTQEEKVYKNVREYVLGKDGQHILYSYQEGAISTLIIENLYTQLSSSYKNVKEYSVNQVTDVVAFIQADNNGDALRVRALSDDHKTFTLVGNNTDTLKKISWNTPGTALGVYRVGNGAVSTGLLYVNQIDLKKATFKKYELTPELNTEVSIPFSPIRISSIGDKVFFDTLSGKEMVAEAKVQEWKSTDGKLFPERQDSYMIWNVWLPASGQYYPVETKNQRACGLTGKEDKILLWETGAYLPLHKFVDHYADLYCLDLKSGKQKKIITQQLTADRHVVANQQGNVVAYFSDNNWWTYNLLSGHKICITENIATAFNKKDNDRLEQNRAYGCGGWTSDGEILLYDKHDIWKIAPDGKKRSRITNGAETGLVYRVDEGIRYTFKNGFFHVMAPVYDINKKTIIKISDPYSLREGFGYWNSRKGFVQVVLKDHKLYNISEIGSTEAFQFLENDFNLPPQLVQVQKREEKIIARSNIQQERYHWGKSDLLHYTDNNATVLKGALFYPAGYDPTQKYPMIVDIYENQSVDLHEYCAPTLENSAGINITNLTLEGYFVLLPDIRYTLNQTGDSALGCILNAIDAAEKTANIDADNIGLHGVSFGGFETTYILSRTHKFKAAVAGGAVTDLLSFYLDIDSSSLSNMERFERAQFRNTIPFTEKDFYRESPLMNVQNVTTPLLLWAGDNDKVVDPKNSLKYYAALWRLGKECKLLLYRNEGHSLLDPKNQMDLTLKTMEWFDHYLKDK